MKSGPTSPPPNVEAAVARAVSFELTIADLARRSERRAWTVAFSAILVALILAGGYFFILPLKERVPYLVMADAYTGTATVARLRGDFAKNDITKQEAVNRSNVAHFVLARESYDAALLKHRDWITVYTMASPAVSSGYTALHAQRNPESPFNVYGNGQAIRVRILSIVLQGGNRQKASTMATVRFQRSLYDKSSGVSAPLDNKIATMEFVYKDNLAMDERYRIENPLGFQVTSYRVDTDYASAPPLEPEAVPPAAVAAMAVFARARGAAATANTSAAAVPAAGMAPAAVPAAAPAGAAPPTPAHGATAQ